MRSLSVSAVVLGGLLGVLLAIGLTPAPEAFDASPSTERPSPSPVPRRAAPEGADCMETADALRRERDALQRRHQTASMIQRVQQVRRAQREGLPQPWPQEVMDRLDPAGFEVAVAEAARATGFQVQGLDCAEFPCVVAVDKTEDLRVTSGSSGEDLQPLLEALMEQLGDVTVVSQIAALRPGPRYQASFALSDRPLGDVEGAQRRVRWRTDQLYGRTFHGSQVTP